MDEDLDRMWGEVFDLFDQERYAEVVEMIPRLPVKLRRQGRMIIALADSHYELADDL